MFVLGSIFPIVYLLSDLICSIIPDPIGFGADQHGQNVTKAAVRACRNAIEFNSIPSIAALIPGGYDRMALRVSLAVPPAYAAGVDIAQVKRVFPYGKCDVEIVAGGAVFTSGIALPALQVF